MNVLVAESVLCVAVDNNEVAGEYFATAPEAHMTVANAFLKNAKPHAFSSAATEATAGPSILDAPTAADAASSAYAPGDAIRTFAAAADKAIHSPVLAGFGPAVGSNECWDVQPVRFEFALAPTTCVHKALDLASVCIDALGALSVAPFVWNVRVAKWPNVTSSAADASDLLSVDVEVFEIDDATGAVSALKAPYPSYFPSPAFVRADSNKSSSVSVCRGALRQLEYRVFHDSKGHLERVRARVTIGNVSLATNASTLGIVDVAQTFAVAFESTSPLVSTVVSLANGNVQTYARSGNPGYLMHYPVRVGVSETNSALADLKTVVAIAEMTGGLQVPGVGECASSVVAQTVGFGEDLQTSCSLTLTADAFRALCRRSDALLPALHVNFTRVAAFGNSDPFLDDEWLTLDYDAPLKSTAVLQDTADQPGAVELLCQDVITTVHYEFLVASVGPVTQPQRKLIAARAFHSKETWRFWTSGSASTKTQTFLLRSTASFVAVQTTELDDLIPPAPPIWFSIPNDVFYPFILNDAPGTTRPPWSALVVLWLATALYFV